MDKNMDKKKMRVSMILNSIIFVLVTLGTIFMLTGFKFMAKKEFFSATKLETFKFFTVDSNVFMGIVALIFLIYEILLIKKKIKEIPSVIYLLKLMATGGVVLTFLVTLLFLAPTAEFSFFAFYQNSNLFFHFVVPVLSFIAFMFYERSDKMPFVYTIYSLLPIFLYSIFYGGNVLGHLSNGVVSSKYDFYGFLKNVSGISIIIVPISITLITYTICYLLWRFNKTNIKKNN